MLVSEFYHVNQDTQCQLQNYERNWFNIVHSPKILKIIVSKSDLISAYRGALGGYVLNRKSSEISVVEIIEALEGPITLTACVENSENLCEASNICFLGGKWNKVNDVIRKTLNDISLNDLLNFGNPFITEGKKEVVVSTIN